MSLKQILETLANRLDSYFDKFYGEYFFREWAIPWLPDDL